MPPPTERAQLEIVDSQVHLNKLVDNWWEHDADEIIALAVTLMDAVGIDRLIVAESFKNRIEWGRRLPNGAIRGHFAFSERALARHPDRFGYLSRIDACDPEIDRVVAKTRATPGVVGVRLLPWPDLGDTAALERGDWAGLFAACERSGLPMFAWLPRRSHLIVPYLRDFPRARVILDHCGVGLAPPTMANYHYSDFHLSSVTSTLSERLEEFESVLRLAAYPNLALKWSHAPAFLSAEPYPFRDAQRLLRRAIDAFGVHRVLWASDYTQSHVETGLPWSRSLHYVLDSEILSEVEKAWVLGRTAHEFLDWPRA